MTLFEIQNNQLFAINAIPFLNRREFTNSVLKELSNGNRMIGLLPVDKNKPEKIIALFADSDSSQIRIVGGEFDTHNLELESFANEYPQTNLFECELSENHGYSIINHPWLRPVRNQKFILGDKPYQFYRIQGDEIHEVAVG